MLGLLPIALTGCFGQNNPTFTVPQTSLSASPALATLLSVDGKSATADLVTEYQDTAAAAKEWHPDAELYTVTVAWPPSLLTGKAKRVYVFGSAAERDHWWTLAINEETKEHIRALVAKSDYLGYELTPIPLAYWKVNAIEALQIADTHGGKEFREANPGSELTASLAAIGPNDWLWWVVNYRGEQTAEKHIRIHPGTGQVYTEAGQPVGASADQLSPTPTASSVTDSASPTSS